MDLNQIGLILNILGTVLIFRYGLPSKVMDKPDTVNYVMTGKRKIEDADKDKKKNRLIFIKAYTGIILIMLGFILQLLSTFSSQ